MDSDAKLPSPRRGAADAALSREQLSGRRHALGQRLSGGPGG
jgi:hypothetical protein